MLGIKDSRIIYLLFFFSFLRQCGIFEYIEGFRDERKQWKVLLNYLIINEKNQFRNPRPANFAPIQQSQLYYSKHHLWKFHV